MHRRLPALSALAVLGTVMLAATAGSSAAPPASPIVVGRFDTVAALPDAAAVPGSSGVESDNTVPADETVVTAPGPARWPGFDGEHFSSLIADRLLGQGALAVGIAVAKDGHLVWESGHGIANSFGELVTAEHRFRIASNSKMLTAATVLSLVQAGQVGLDDVVLQRIADAFGVPLGDSRMAHVTVRQLLSHTSGFRDYTSQFFGEQAVSCEDATVQAVQGRLGGQPGASVNYSNENFCLLGLLIEQLTGDGYEQAVYDRLLTPLGVTTARVTGNDDLRSGEVDHPGGVERNFMEVLGGAGAWLASAADMVKIVDSFDTTRPGWHPFGDELSAEQKGEGAAQAVARSYRFGLGLRLWDDGSWGHTGTIQNAHSMVLHRPDGITFAILVSGPAPSESDDLKGIAERAFAEVGLPSTQLVEVPVSGPTIEEQIGLDPLPSPSAHSPS
jgi:D-alanyl-D-alanine carboxypeptidase